MEWKQMNPYSSCSQGWISQVCIPVDTDGKQNWENSRPPEGDSETDHVILAPHMLIVVNSPNVDVNECSRQQSDTLDLHGFV